MNGPGSIPVEFQAFSPPLSPFVDIWFCNGSNAEKGESLGALRIVLENYGLRVSGDDFRIGKYGKPDLPGKSTLFFNTSTDGEQTVVAVTDAGEVGVDLQSAFDPETHRGAMETVFTPGERMIFRDGDNLFPVAVYWAVKEALVKQEGSSIFFGDRYEVADGVEKRYPGRWCRLGGHRVYFGLWEYTGSARALALALPGTDAEPPAPRFIRHIGKK